MMVQPRMDGTFITDTEGGGLRWLQRHGRQALNNVLFTKEFGKVGHPKSTRSRGCLGRSTPDCDDAGMVDRRHGGPNHGRCGWQDDPFHSQDIVTLQDGRCRRFQCRSHVVVVVVIVVVVVVGDADGLSPNDNVFFSWFLRSRQECGRDKLHRS